MNPYRELMAGVVQQAVDDYIQLCEDDCQSECAGGGRISFAEIRQSVDNGIIAEYLLVLGIDREAFWEEMKKKKMRISTARNSLIRGVRPTEIKTIRYCGNYVYMKAKVKRAIREYVYTDYGLFGKVERENENNAE